MMALLPAMDGTGASFEPFLKALPTGYAVRVIRYPPDVPLTYAELEQHVLDHLPTDEPITLIAESFSGPIALRLSAKSNLNIRVAILVCSFGSRPLGSLGTVIVRLPISSLLRFDLPPAVMRVFLLGNSASDELVAATAAAISSVRPQVLATRLREALTSRYCQRQIVAATRVIALFSKRDRLLGKAAVRSVLSTCPNVETHMMDAPHFAWQTVPDQIIRSLSELGVLDEKGRK
jgi:pimeloyl-[acyl-carrier protein] methyl ester esterase